MILAKRDSVSRIIVMRLSEWDQVGCINNVKPALENDPQAACRATVIVHCDALCD